MGIWMNEGGMYGDGGQCFDETVVVCLRDQLTIGQWAELLPKADGSFLFNGMQNILVGLIGIKR